ncbi:MAG TPA: hypothetical protein VLL52_13585 [Anaerolineae bacterium]|nr:hypothetical protein [Anaerolineae bacterium]
MPPVEMTMRPATVMSSAGTVAAQQPLHPTKNKTAPKSRHLPEW